MPTATNPAPALPPALAIGLKRLAARLRRRRIARAAGNLLLAVSLTLIFVPLADFLLNIPLALRWGIWAALIAGCGHLIIRDIIILLIHRPQWTDLAAVASRANPELGERLTAAVALRADEAAGRAHGSPAMIAAMADRAADSLGQIDLAATLPGRPATRRLTSGIAAAAIPTLLVLAFPNPFASLAERVLMPWRNVERIGRYLVVVRDGDRVIARGDNVTLTAEVRPRFGASPDSNVAQLLWTDPDGKTQRAPMVADPSTPHGTRTWRLTRPRVDASFRYTVESGSIKSDSHQITAIERPAIARLTATVAPPPYTHKPAEAIADATHIEALHASAVTLNFNASRPLRRAVLQWPEPPAAGNAEAPLREFPATPNDREGRSWTVTAPALASGRFEIILFDNHEIASAPGSERYIVVRPDAAPTVAWTDSDAGLNDARGDDNVPGEVAASDDLAVAAAELHYRVTRKGTDAPPEAGQRPVALDGIGTPKAQGAILFDLRSLGLQPGDVVAYRVKVLDNRPPEMGGPGVGWTPDRTVTITENAAPLARRRGEAERSAIRERIEAIQALAHANRQATEPLRYSADTARRDPSAWNPDRSREVRDREADARKIIDRLQLFARDLAAQPPFAPLARPTEQIAEVETAAARDALARAAQAIDAEARFEALKEADSALGAVVSKLDELKRQLEDQGKLNDDRRRLDDLAHRQQALAARTQEHAQNPADTDQLNQAAAEQNALSHELDQILKQSPQLRAETLAAQQEHADDLAKQARTLADRQREEAKLTSDPAPRAAALRELAAQQKAIEDDARRLALRVDEPLTQNSRGRLNADALAQTTTALDRGDIDAARRETENAEAELRRLARDIADVRDDPRALARRLLRRQDALRRDLHTALRETLADASKVADIEKEDLAKALKPLQERQKALAALAAQVPVPKDRLDTRDQAVARQNAAIDAMSKADTPREMQQRQDEAHDTLRRLADAVPDAITRRLPQRKRVESARRRTDEVVREVERHLRETAPRPGQPFQAPDVNAALAQKLADTTRKQAETADDLESLNAGDRLEPQRRAAAARARALQEALAKPDRETLPALAQNAKAAMERLAQAAAGQTTADVVAAEIAGEIKGLINTPDSNLTAEAPRLRAGLNSLNVPDAEEAREKAAQAVGKLASPDATHDDRQAAQEAAEALVARLTEPPQPPDTQASTDPIDAPVPDDPALDLDPKRAEEALALARRQRGLRERVQALLADRIPPQQAIQEESISLAQRAEEIGQAAAEASPRARNAADQARQLLEHDAPSVMDQATSQLGQGQAEPARETQRRAAEILDRAADHAENLAAAIRADTPPESAQNPESARLGEAQEAQRDASQKLTQAQDAQGAAEAMQRAAEDLHAAAEAHTHGESQGQPGEPGSPTESPTLTPESAPAGTAEADLARLQQELRARTGRSWGELPGHLRTEILNQAQGRYRADYARLIQLYFREIAQSSTNGKTPDANRSAP